MAGKRIKGITIELNGETKGLDKALQDVNKRSRDVNKELRDVDKLLKFNPGNTELIAQKQKLLGDQVQTTRDKLNQLKSAEEEVQRQFENGEIGEEQYRAFQREVVETESKLKHFESQLEGTQTKFDRFSDGMNKAGDKVQNIGKGMKTAGGNMTKFVTGPIAAGTAGLVGLAKSAGDTADRILDLSAITGMSTDSIQEWQHVATVAGVEQEALTNAVEGLVRKIPQLESEGGKATEQLNKLGLSFSDLKNMSPDEQVDTLMKRLSEMEDPLEANAIGSQLFGGAWKDIAPILSMGSGAMEEAKNEAHALGTVMSEDSLNNANDFRIEIDKLVETFKAMFQQIGAELAPVLRDTLAPLIKDTLIPAFQSFAEKIGEIIEWFGELSPKTQQFILGAIGLVAALGPLLIIIGQMSIGLGGMLKLLPTLITSLKALGGVFRFLLGAANPWMLAIGALIAIGVLLWKNWDTIKEKAFKIWGAIKSFLGKTWDGIKSVASSVFGWIKSFISGIWDGIKSITSTVWGGIKKLVINPITSIWGFVKKIFSKIKNFIGDSWDGVKEGTDKVWDGIKGSIKGAINGVIGAINGMIKALNSLKIKLPKIPDWVPGLGGKGGGSISFPDIPKIPKLDVGTNYVKKDGLAMIHEGEAVVPKKYNPALGNGEGKTMTLNLSLIVDGEELTRIVEPNIDTSMSDKLTLNAYLRGSR